MATLRPEDPFARGINSFLMQTNHALLKVSVPKRTGRKRKRGSDDPFEVDTDYDPNKRMPIDAKSLFTMLNDNHENYTVKPVALLPESHLFRSMPDLQYASFNNGLMRKIRDQLLSNEFDKFKTFTLNPEKGQIPGQEIQPPPALQLTQLPIPYGYKQNNTVKFIRENGVVQSINTALVPRTIVHTIPFDALTVPSESPVPLPPVESLDARVQECIGRLRAALKTRPVMSRRVQNVLGKPATEDILKRCWAYLGYMFRTGPFRDVLITFGVDPRSDPKYRIYQSISIQIPEGRGKDRFGEEDLDSDDGIQKTYIFDGRGVYIDGRVWQICDVTDRVLKKHMDGASIQDEFDVCVSIQSISSQLTSSSLRHQVGTTMELGPSSVPF
jgi:general transcription factor 3C polypeptide 5 (transcription factor C subunit 1)